MGTRRRQRPAQQPPQSQSPRAGLAACDVQMGTKLVVPSSQQSLLTWVYAWSGLRRVMPIQHTAKSPTATKQQVEAIRKGLLAAKGLARPSTAGTVVRPCLPVLTQTPVLFIALPL